MSNVQKLIKNCNKAWIRSVQDVKKAIRNSDIFVQADRWGMTNDDGETEDELYNAILDELNKDRR